MDKKLIVILLISLFALAIYIEGTGGTIREELRFSVSRFFGEDVAKRIFGNSSEEITLPTLPSVEENSKSIRGYGYRDEVEEKLLRDSEFLKQKRNLDIAFLEEIYAVVAYTGVTDEQMSSWLNAITQGGSREGIYRAVLSSDEYRAKEMADVKSPDKLISFIHSFAERYLGKNLSEDQLRSANAFIVKRIIIEKTLELIDVLKANRVDLARWYAVLSSDLATHSKGFKYPRDLTDKKFHFDWANNMPIDHIKSETIIKLSIVLNSLIESV